VGEQLNLDLVLTTDLGAGHYIDYAKLVVAILPLIIRAEDGRLSAL